MLSFISMWTHFRHSSTPILHKISSGVSSTRFNNRRIIHTCSWLPRPCLPRLRLNKILALPILIPRFLASLSPQNHDSELEQIQLELQKQVEFYFSKENLKHDKFLRSTFDKQSRAWKLSEIATFSRIKILWPRPENRIQGLVTAVKNSPVLKCWKPKDSTEWLVGRLQDYTCQDVGIRTQSNRVPPPFQGHNDESSLPSALHINQRRQKSQLDLLFGAPCKYYYAGYCDRKRQCPSSHDMEFAAIIEKQWLDPTSSDLIQQLKQTAMLKRIPPAMAVPAQKVGIDTLGKINRIRNFEPGQRFSTSIQDASYSAPNPGPFDYYIIVDVEGRDEIIEFPALVIDAKRLVEIGRFHRWVAPIKLFRGKTLNPYSTAIPFDQVLVEFQQWLACNNILTDIEGKGENIAFICCGDWDMKTQIPKQCAICNCQLPDFMRNYVNIKDIFNGFYTSKYPITGMKQMLRRLQMLNPDGSTIGMHHLGMADVENIARILVKMVAAGAQIKYTARNQPVTKMPMIEPIGFRKRRPNRSKSTNTRSTRSSQ